MLKRVFSFAEPLILTFVLFILLFKCIPFLVLFTTVFVSATIVCVSFIIIFVFIMPILQVSLLLRVIMLVGILHFYKLMGVDANCMILSFEDFLTLFILKLVKLVKVAKRCKHCKTCKSNEHLQKSMFGSSGVQPESCTKYKEILSQ